jgi:plastocyanin domain-containing protein
MDKIIVTIVGVSLIGFIYWFFLGKKDSSSKTGKVSGDTTIVVAGGYKPDVVYVKENTKTTLTFLRKENNACLEEIVIPDFGVKEYLPMDKPVAIEITPIHKGEYDIHCGMNMFHGKIIVK